MRSIINLAVSILFLSVVISAQSPPPPPAPPPPPPPPLVYEAPKADKVKSFISDEFDFSIDFAGILNHTNVNDNGIQKNIYKSAFIGSNESVVVNVFPVNLEKTYSAKKIADYFKAKYLENIDFEIVNEREFEKDGIKGFELRIEKYLEYEIIKAFIVENRIYELKVDVTNWGFLNRFHKNNVIDFEKEVSRFFDSFKVNKELVKNKVAKISTDKKFELIIPDKPIETYSLKTGTYTNFIGGFKIKLPKKPTKNVDNISIGFGETDYHSFSAPVNYGLYALTYLDLPTALENENEKELLYAEQVNGILRQPNFTKISEEKSKVSMHTGLEVLITNGQERLHIVMFLVEQRFYRMIFVRGEIINNISETSKNQIENNFKLIANNYFQSFEIIKIPEAKFKQQKLPESFDVKFIDNILIIGYFNFSIVLPTDLYYLSNEENKLVKKSVIIDEEKSENTRKKINLHSIQNTEFLFSGVRFAKDNETLLSSILIGVEKPIFPNFKPNESIKWLMEKNLEPNEKAISGIEMATFDSVEFAWFESYFKNDDMKQRVYIANIDGLSFQIVFNYKNKTELNSVLESLKTIEFGRKTNGIN